MDSRVRLPLTPDEHAALERLATAQRRSMGAQAAVMLAPLLVPTSSSPLSDLLGPWRGTGSFPVEDRERLDRNGVRRLRVFHTLSLGWRWERFDGNGWPVGEPSIGWSSPAAAMDAADAALGEGT